MLKRLSTTRKGVKDQIVEVLLTRDQLLPALRFIRNTDVIVNRTTSPPPLSSTNQLHMLTHTHTHDRTRTHTRPHTHSRTIPGGGAAAR